MDFKSIHGQWQICFGPTAVGMGNVMERPRQLLLVVRGGGANRINKRLEYSSLPCTGSRKEDQLSL